MTYIILLGSIVVLGFTFVRYVVLTYRAFHQVTTGDRSFLIYGIMNLIFAIINLGIIVVILMNLKKIIL